MFSSGISFCVSLCSQGMKVNFKEHTKQKAKYFLNAYYS